MRHFLFFGRRGLLVLGLLLATAVGVWAQAPAWQTALAISGGDSRITATAADAGGNVYVAGEFVGTIGLGRFTLTSVGGKDMFVAKWHPTSGFVWAQSAGGALGEGATALAVSGTSVYVGGYFVSQSVRFGSVVLGNSPCGQPGGGCQFRSMFLVKLAEAGPATAFTWAQWTGIGTEALALAAVGPQVYVAGLFEGTAYFGNTTLMGAAIGGDAYWARLTDAGPTGTFDWARRTLSTGTNSRAKVHGLAVQGLDVYLAGNFSGTVSFGGAPLTSDGFYPDAYVAKITATSAGSTTAWALRAGGAQADQATAVAVSGTEVYLAGSFQSVAAGFGPVVLANTNPALEPRAFLSKLTDQGSSAAFAWVQQAEGITGDQAPTVAVNGASIYLAGSFRNTTAGFGSISLTNTNAGRSTTDVFVAKLLDAGTAGSFVWAQQGGGSNSYDDAQALTVTGTGVQVAGRTTGPTAFGGTVLPAPGAEAGFLAILTDATPTATAPGALALELAVLPNPAYGRATVQVPAVPGAATATLTVLDALGRTLRTQPAALNARASLDLTGFAPGLYAVRMQAGATTATRRLVVE